MRRLLRAGVLAAIMVALLVGGARADAAGLMSDGPGRVRQSGQWAPVAKAYGAAIRVAPSSDATIMYHRPCGDVLAVVGASGGWLRVLTPIGDEGWVGGGRVVVGSPPPAVDCSGARLLWTTGYAATYLPTGCLSLRESPSRDAPILACVGNGHVYRLMNGPFDPGTGEDWFAVFSPSTGYGWSLAEHLYML